MVLSTSDSSRPCLPVLGLFEATLARKSYLLAISGCGQSSKADLPHCRGAGRECRTPEAEVCGEAGHASRGRGQVSLGNSPLHGVWRQTSLGFLAP